nr:MAG: replication initiator protein [Microvirus sp.]
MCYYPISLNARATKEGVYIPPSLVPCGRCIECLQTKRASWSFRLKQELIKAKSATFLTLTLNDEHLKKIENCGKYYATLEKKLLQDYFKRVRKYNKHKLKYFAVGEYGEKNNRPHYHAIVFNSDNNLLREKWGDYGFVSTDNVSDASIHYVTGYVLKKYGEIDEISGISKETYSPGLQPPFSIMSKGLGLSYVNSAKDYHISNQTFKTQKGAQSGYLSRYLKSKIFESNELLRLQITEQEKQKITDDLKQKMKTGKVSSKRYYKELIKHSQKKKKL